MDGEYCPRACRIIEAFHEMEYFSRLGFFLSNGIAPLGKNSRKEDSNPKFLASLPECSCTGVECLLPRDDWIWQPPMNTPQVQTFGKNATFHPDYAFGSAAARGDRALTQSSLAYWEIHSDRLNYGTSIMYGVGTCKAKTSVNYQFVDLIGTDIQSYGLNHRGWAFHGGLGVQVCDPFIVNGYNRIGLFFNGPARSLSFFINDIYLCTPFTQIDTSRPLYPMISSTCQQSKFQIMNQYYWNSPPSLLRLSMERILRITPSNKLSELPLPQELIKQISAYEKVLREKVTQTEEYPPRVLEIIERLFEHYYK